MPRDEDGNRNYYATDLSACCSSNLVQSIATCRRRNHGNDGSDDMMRTQRWRQRREGDVHAE